MTTGDLIKHVFPSPQDIGLTQDSNQMFLPGGGGGVGVQKNSQNSPYISVWPQPFFVIDVNEFLR